MEKHADQDRVLVITGGFVTAEDVSLVNFLKKQITQWRFSQSAWLELKIKAVIAEPLVCGAVEKRRWRGKNTARFLSSTENAEAPSLTEVVLTSLLHEAGIPYEVATYTDLFSDERRMEKILSRTSCVFASSTFLRDLSELEPVVRRLKRKHNRVVVGGALAGSLCNHWEGSPEVDVLAIGYGELLVPSLVDWIKSDYKELSKPEFGRIEKKRDTLFLYSGVPKSLNLDFLPTPNWKLSERDHGRDYKMIYYESVRGCPYRCAFCNYPYLFDDTKFRMKSAAKVADDWQQYVDELGVEYITCLDSLFTMPKPRLVEFCNLLIERGIKVKWICYARADDLCDEKVVQLMRRAGALQVQIGIESGDEGQLANMNKKVNVEKNLQALRNCRKHGLTSVISLIVGFPGETRESIENTYQFLKEGKPDFHFIATFSARVPGVPILTPESRARFGLHVMDNAYSVSPYWIHDSMSCAEVGNHVRELSRRLILEKISLDSTLFYRNLLAYEPGLRDDLLEFQARAVNGHPWVTKIFNGLNGWIDKRLGADVQKFIHSVRAS